LFDIIKATVQEFLDDDAPRLAAALSYYTVFSLPAILILILLVTGFFTDADAVADRIVDETQDVLGEDGATQIQTMIRQASDLGGGGLATVLSLAAVAFGATGAFFQLQMALNKAWSVAPDPEAGIKDFALKRALSFGMVLAIAFLLLVSLALSALLTRAGNEIAELLPGVLSGGLLLAIDIGLSLAVVTVLFAAIFKVMPDAEITWRDVGIGAFVTAVLFILVKYLFGFFLSMADPGSAFGAAGSLAVIMVWVYVASMVLFLGAEFTQVWARRRGKRIQPSKGAVRVVKESQESRRVQLSARAE
jgi:membrane protein